MRIPDKILSLPADEAGRQLALEALIGLRSALDRDPPALARALTELRGQLEIFEEPLAGVVRKSQRRLVKEAWSRVREFEQLCHALEFGLSLESRRGFPDLHSLLRNELRKRTRRLRKTIEEEIRPALVRLIGDLEDSCDKTSSGRGGSSHCGEVLADWILAEARGLSRRFASAKVDEDGLQGRLERFIAALTPWSAHFAAAIPVLDGLQGPRQGLARRRHVAVLRSAAEATGDALVLHAIATLGDEVERQGLAADFTSQTEQLATAFRKGALSRLDEERLFILRDLPTFAGEAAVAEIYQGWLPGARVEETISRVYEGGAPRHSRRVGLGRGTKRVEVEEETTEAVFESLWGLTEGCRVRKRRYSLAESERRVEIEEYHDRELLIARLVGRAAAVAEEPPAWLAGTILREVTAEGAFRGRRLGI